MQKQDNLFKTFSIIFLTAVLVLGVSAFHSNNPNNILANKNVWQDVKEKYMPYLIIEQKSPYVGIDMGTGCMQTELTPDEFNGLNTLMYDMYKMTYRRCS
jgi:hypothetical protein